MTQLEKVYNAILAGGRRSVPTHDEVQRDLIQVERNLTVTRDLPF
jgi:hypothetical protein